MTDKPTPKEIGDLFVEETGFDIDDFPAAILDFASAVLAKWGTPAPVGVGEAAERYRNAIARACEGWTMPDGLRKHLEAALWNPPTPQPTHAQAGAVPLTNAQLAEMMRETWGCASIAPRHAIGFARAIEAEVRKSDDALLQAALDALTCTGESDDPGHRCGHCDDYVDRNGQVRAALRARLEGKP